MIRPSKYRRDPPKKDDGVGSLGRDRQHNQDFPEAHIGSLRAVRERAAGMA
jgi:hypothetical protein